MNQRGRIYLTIKNVTHIGLRPSRSRFCPLQVTFHAAEYALAMKTQAKETRLTAGFLIS